MKHFLPVATLAVALIGCASAPQPTTVAASPAVVAKCGPPPVRSLFHENSVQFQQRQAVYALCARDDPSYPTVLGASIQAERERAATQALQYQQGQDFVNQSQTNFWNMVGAMNSLPR